MLKLIMGAALFVVGTFVGGGIYAIGAEEDLKAAHRECAEAKDEARFWAEKATGRAEQSCEEDCM